MQEIKHRSGKNEIERRVCAHCKLYFPTLKVSQAHARWCKWNHLDDDEDDEDDGSYVDPDTDVGDLIAMV